MGELRNMLLHTHNLAEKYGLSLEVSSVEGEEKEGEKRGVEKRGNRSPPSGYPPPSQQNSRK